MRRETILERAITCVTRDRNSSYGEPENNFQRIANLWNCYFTNNGIAVELSPVDVALVMALLKLARISASPECDDHYIDAAGYFACAGELATETTVTP